MVHEVISEEIETVLTIDRVHADKVGRVLSISEQLHTHAGSKVRSLGVGRLGHREAGVASVGTFEHATVGVTAKILPLDLGNNALGMNYLVAATVPVTGKFITLGVENGGLVDEKSPS